MNVNCSVIFIYVLNYNIHLYNKTLGVGRLGAGPITQLLNNAKSFALTNNNYNQ